MSMKKRISAAALISAVGLSGLASSAMAEDGTITFKGEITDTTCTVSGGGAATGTGDITVQMPTVSKSALPSVGSTAGDTSFSLVLGGANCADGKTAAMNVETSQTLQLDYATGALKNTGTASGVQVRLVNPANNQPINLGVNGTYANGATVVSGSNQPAATTQGNSATLNYAAQYLAVDPVDAGSVNTSLVYSMSYN
ncbi:fimbrial protein [Pseudomonas sp. CAN2814]|uniref:fimbrial protein n=1 Tax=Pseudomonas sp. CAN1 TaxID=3046726 RepID=UPI002647B3BF|nr:fimbrial protein [Pseudomonas sp. CAN1]MDN6859911.1 fimbrial protein [Pseudomonas sp. CAN1]